MPVCCCVRETARVVAEVTSGVIDNGSNRPIDPIAILETGAVHELAVAVVS